MPEAPSWDQAISALTGAGGPFEIVEKEIAGHPIKVFANTPVSLRERFLAARLHVSSDRRTVSLYYDEPLPPSAVVRVTIDGEA